MKRGWTAMRPNIFMLRSLFDRIAVLAARSAAKQNSQPAKGSRNVKGRALGWIWSVVLLVMVLAAVGWARVMPDRGRHIPTARVQRGRVQVTVYANGELRARRSLQINVPPAGGSMTIVQIAVPGSAVKAGDVIVELDPSEQEFTLEQAEFDLQLAEQEIAKADAEAAVQAAEDDVALLKARFDVRRAELDAAANELVAAVVAKQNLLLLEEARQRLAQLEVDVRSHRATSTASMAGLREKRNKARVAVDAARRTIDSLRVRAPFDGYVTLRPNYMAFGGMIMQGVVVPEFRVGDVTSAGQLIGELIDMSRVEVAAKLPENDRANVNKGQAVRISVDAVPTARLDGTVRAVSGVASRQMFEGGSARQFDIAFDVVGDVSHLRPGVSAALEITGPVFENALFVPRPAVFEVAGKPSVYLRSANGFETRDIKIRAFTSTVAVVEGLGDDAEVALVNPNSTPANQPRPAQPASPRTAS